MENTSSLSIESFSRTWLVNFSPTTSAAQEQPPPPQHSCNTSFDASDEASFIEMDPKLSDSRRFYRVAKDFSFDFRALESPVTLTDADELFTDGLLMPFFSGSGDNDRLIKTEESETCNYYYNHTDQKTESSASPRLISSFSQKEVNSSNRIVCAASLRRCKSVSKRIFHIYLDFIAPLCQKLRRRRSASRVASMSTQFDPCSPAAAAASSPKPISAIKYAHFLGDSECSITDAVLHCKRTNGRLMM